MCQPWHYGRFSCFHRSIEELQEQNQRLLEVARELSEKQEQDEQNVTDDK